MTQSNNISSTPSASCIATQNELQDTQKTSQEPVGTGEEIPSKNVAYDPDQAKNDLFKISNKSNPADIKLQDANIKNHKVTVGDGTIARMLKKIHAFLKDIFNLTKSWLGIARNEKFLQDKTLPLFLVKDVEKHGDGTYTTSYALTNIQNKLFENLVTNLQGNDLTKNLSPEAQSMNGLFAVEQDSAVQTNEKSKAIFVSHGLTHQFIRDMSGEGILINDELYFDQTKKGELETPEKLTEYVNSLRDKMVELCNGNELAAVVLCRFINQQITADAAISFKSIPLGKNQETGYFALAPRPSYRLEKSTAEGPVKLIINMQWTSEKGMLSLGEGMEAEIFDDPSEVLLGADFNFELEFNPPKKDPEKDTKDMDASYFTPYMRLSKGLTIDVRRNDVTSLAIQEKLSDSGEDESPKEVEPGTDITLTENIDKNAV